MKTNDMTQPPLTDPDGDLSIERGGSTIAMSVMRQATQSTKQGVTCSAGCVIDRSEESVTRRDKCIEERSKPISEQRGAVICSSCHRWFRSRGGLAVHVCRPTPNQC